MTSTAKLRLAIFLMVVIFVGGTIGYATIEDWPILDSIYMTVITLATVGFGEVRPLSDAGRAFTVFLIVFGATNMGFIISAVAQFVLEGQLMAILGKRRMEKKLSKLKNHIILCGYGRVGKQVAKEFAAREASFVIIEKNPEALQELQETEYFYLEGNAADDDMLERAGIKNAKTIVSTLPDDADNVYLALTARQINPDLLIIARAESMPAKKKLARAGADRVFCPHELGGTQMALATIRPNVVDFVQLASEVVGGEKLGIEEIVISKGGDLTGKTIIEAAIKSKYDAIVVGLKKNSGKMIFNPSGETTMEGGDILIVLGESAKLESLAADLA